MNSTALRENKPGDGTSSLTPLSPKDNSRSHFRRPSNTTMVSTDEGTIADHSPGFSHLYPATSNMTVSVRSAADTFHSTTPTHVSSTSTLATPGNGSRNTRRLGRSRAPLKGQRWRRRARRRTSRWSSTLLRTRTSTGPHLPPTLPSSLPRRP
jgi:hypothetical protein